MRILKKILKWTGIVIVGLLILSIIIHTVLNIVWGRELRAKLAELKAKGEPITIAEIRPAPVPDKENAAVLYNKVFMLMTSGEGGKPYIPNKEGGEENKTIGIIEDVKFYSDISKWTEKQRQEVPKLVNSPDMQYIYALLEQASKRPECNFNLRYGDGAAMLLPHLAKMRSLARLLCVKALIEADAGKTDKSFNTVLTGLRISNHLKNEPVLISQLVRIACDRIVINCLEPLSSKYSISQERMKSLITELENHVGTEPFKKCMDTERICLAGVEFNKLLKRKYSIKELKALFGSSDDFFLKLVYIEVTPPFKPLLKKDFVCYLSFMSDMKELYNMSYSESVIAGRNIELKLKTGISKYCVLTRMLVPALTRVREQMSLHEAQIQVCRTGLALKIYKAKYGTYPDSLFLHSLDKLTPDILKKVPSDPFTDRNLIYKRAKHGFILYSLGSNMKDDGGTPGFRGKAKTDAQRKAKKDYDIVWKREK